MGCHKKCLRCANIDHESVAQLVWKSFNGNLGEKDGIGT